MTCVGLHNMLRTHQGGVVREPAQPDDVVAIANKPVVYVPDENCINLLRTVKYQQLLLEDCFNYDGALFG